MVANKWVTAVKLPDLYEWSEMILSEKLFLDEIRLETDLFPSLLFRNGFGFFPWPIEVSKTAQLGTKKVPKPSYIRGGYKTIPEMKNQITQPHRLEEREVPPYGLELPSPGPQDAGSSPPG